MLSLRRALLSAMVLATATAGLFAMSSCTAATDRDQASLTDLQSVGLKQLWEHRITLAGGEKIAHTWRVGDSIYVATSQAHLVRLNALAGTVAWEIDLGNRDYQIFRPADVAETNNLLVINRGQARLVNKQTGDTIKQHPLEIAVTTDPIVTGNTFCVGGVNYFYALYLDMLEGKKWVTAAKDDSFTAQPAVQGDTVLLASESGKLWRVNLANGDWVWRDRKTNGRVLGGLAADARAVFIPCLDGNVYAFDMKDGAQLWNTPLKGRLDKTLITTRSDVLVPTGDSLYSLSAAKGDVRWHADGIKSVGTIAGDRIWVTDSAGNIKAISLDTGEDVVAAPAAGATLVANSEDKLVILVSRGGTVGVYAAK